MMARGRAALVMAGLVAAACTGPVVAPPRSPAPGYGLRLAFDEQGRVELASPATVADVVTAAHGGTDVFVFSHGWWNTPDTAECRYRQMIDGLHARRPAALSGDSFRPVLVGIYWPSAIFPVEKGDCDDSVADEPPPEARGSVDLSAAIAVWARAAFPTAARQPEFEAEVDAVMDALAREQRGARLSSAEGRRLATILLRWRDSGRPEGVETRDGPGEDALEGSAEAVASRWEARTTPPPDDTSEARLRARWLDFANVFTFWTIKARAGIVGSRGGYELLRALQPYRAQGLRLHLVGHSFGGKLLSAAITGHGRSPSNEVDSLVILQGAFSHFAFSTADEIRRLGVATDAPGLYVDVLLNRRVSGPLVVTYSRQDRANRVWYPRGVVLSNDFLEAAGIGKYGSLGADGVQGPVTMREGIREPAIRDALRARSARVLSIDATNVIRGHSDLVKHEVFDLIWDVIVATQRAAQ